MLGKLIMQSGLDLSALSFYQLSEINSSIEVSNDIILDII